MQTFCTHKKVHGKEVAEIKSKCVFKQGTLVWLVISMVSHRLAVCSVQYCTIHDVRCRPDAARTHDRRSSTS